MIDGPVLRNLRQSKGVALRRLARVAGMSHGHLSKVERGEVGRPITPAVLRAYERACGVDLTGQRVAQHSQDWLPGELSDAARRRYAGMVGAVASGGVLDGVADGAWTDPARLAAYLERRGWVPNEKLDEAGLSCLAQVTNLLVGLEGVVPGQAAAVLLRWTVKLLADVDEQLAPGLHVVVSYLALRAGQAAVELGAHESARSLYLVALYNAVTAGEPDLAGRVLASIAEQHIGLSHYREAAAACRLGEADERISEPIRSMVSAIRTRAIDAERRIDERVRAATEAQHGG